MSSLGLFALNIFLGLWKAFSVARSISPHDQIAHIATIIAQDVPYFSIVLFCIYAEKKSAACFKKISRILIALLTFLYAVHTIVIIELDFGLTLSTILRFIHEPGIIASFLSFQSFFLAACIIPVALYRRTLSYTLLFCTTSLCAISMLILTLCGATHDFEKYTFSLKMFLLDKEFYTNSLTYSPGEISKLVDQFVPISEPRIPNSHPNIIVVVVESLSSVDVPSLFTKSLGMMSALDEIAQKGLLFTSMIANGTTSEFGVAATFSGTKPIPYPGGTGNPHADFASMPTVLSYYKGEGYYPLLITTGDLAFLDQGAYASGVGFEKVIGRTDTERFRKSPRFALNCPPDAALYTEALEHLDQLHLNRQQPFLMALLTTSSHPPWKDPLLRGNTEANVWNYVGQELSRFVTGLEEKKFFDNGYLVVVGDHRKYTPVTDDELDVFGLSARFRIPLFIMGSGITPGSRTDIPVQQSDILSKLFDLPKMTQPAGNILLSYDVESAQYKEEFQGPFAPLMVYLPKSNHTLDGFKADIDGKSVHWLEHKVPPQFAEDSIHQLRAYYQYNAGNYKSVCPRSVPHAKTLIQTSVKKTQVFDGTKISDDALLTSKKVKYSFNMNSFSEVGERFWLVQNKALRITSGFDIDSSDSFQFKVRSDDGACLYVDGELVVDGGFIRRATPSFGELLLESGYHQYEIRYFQVGGGAQLSVDWRTSKSQIWKSFGGN